MALIGYHMILGDRVFKKLEELLSSEDNNKIDFILIDYQYKREKNKVALVKRFIPIYNDIRIKKRSGVQIGVNKEQLEDVMLISPAFVVYDKQRYIQIKGSNIESIVLETIRNSGNEERYNRVLETLKDKNINISDYEAVVDNQNFIQTLSDIFHTQTIYKYIITELSKLDKHFLKKEQIKKVVESSHEFDSNKYNELKPLKQKAYIDELYKSMDTMGFYINSDITKNVTTILNKYEMYEVLKKYFFDKDDYLDTIDNIFDKKIVPTPTTKQIMKEIYNLIYSAITSNQNISIHPSVRTIQKEIQNKVKYVNLYTYEDSYGVELYKDSLSRLYKRVSKNRISSIDISTNIHNYFKQRLDESAFYKFKMSEIAHEQASKIMLEAENNYDGISDKLEYEQDYIFAKIAEEDYYYPYMRENEINIPRYRDIIDASIQQYQQVFRDDFLFEHYRLEKEFEENIVEEYVKTSKKEMPQEEIEEDYVINLRESIPTTKLVKGNYKRIPTSEVETILQEKVVQYKQQQDSKKSNEAFSKKFDTEISTENEIKSLLDDFYKKGTKDNSQDLFYKIMKLGLEE